MLVVKYLDYYPLVQNKAQRGHSEAESTAVKPSNLPNPHPGHSLALDHHLHPALGLGKELPWRVGRSLLISLPFSANTFTGISNVLQLPSSSGISLAGIGVICFNKMNRHPSSSSHPALSTQASPSRSPTASGLPSRRAAVVTE